VFDFGRAAFGTLRLALDVRETARIVGDVTVTAADYCSGRQWDDALCHAFYPIDLHTTSGTGLDKRPLQKGVVPSVPRGALLPQGLNRIVVATAKAAMAKASAANRCAVRNMEYRDCIDHHSNVAVLKRGRLPRQTAISKLNVLWLPPEFAKPAPEK
jgi:hypothetical protein